MNIEEEIILRAIKKYNDNLKESLSGMSSKTVSVKHLIEFLDDAYNATEDALRSE